jgi:hypothetical protein
MIRKHSVSLILAVILALTLLVGPAVESMNAGSTYSGTFPAEVVSNPTGGGNTGG